jgi:hypothetical protein
MGVGRDKIVNVFFTSINKEFYLAEAIAASLITGAVLCEEACVANNIKI